MGDALPAGASLGGRELYRLDIDSRALSINELRLIAQAQAGDRLAFEELVRIHAEPLYAVVLRLCTSPHEAEEVTQEAFLRAWPAIGPFPSRPHLFTLLYPTHLHQPRP